MPAAQLITENGSNPYHRVNGVGDVKKLGKNHVGDFDKRSTGPANNQVTNGITNGIDGAIIRSSPVAICGLALRLPGGVRNAESFWDILINGKDTRGPIPPDRYNVRGFSNAMSEKGAIKSQYGYFLDEELSCLDTSFFTMTQSELERMDPQQRQVLEITRECLETAGEIKYRGKLVGCYVGTFGEDWLQMSAKESQHSGGYVMTGHGDLMIANRISFEFDFMGPRQEKSGKNKWGLTNGYLVWSSRPAVLHHSLDFTKRVEPYKVETVLQLSLLGLIWLWDQPRQRQ